MNNNMTFTMKARIDSSDVHKGKTFTLVTVPAPDGFSHPSRFKVASTQALGSPGQIIDLTVSVNGMIREKNYRDKDTGQPRTFHDASVLLNVEDWKHTTLEPVHSVDASKSAKSA